MAETPLVPWHGRTPSEVAEGLETSLESGLDSDQAAERLETHGHNEVVVASSSNWLALLASQFSGPLTAVLFAAIVVSLVVGEQIDALVIAAILALNGLLGFAQEWRAEKTIAELDQLMSPTATVTRSSRSLVVEARDLVPGDLVELAAGDLVPADLRLTEAAQASVDESALTGESVPVGKRIEAVEDQAVLAERSSVAYMGTALVSGNARGLVVGTGLETELGSIATLSEQADSTPTPLSLELGGLSRMLGIASVVIAAATAAVGILSGRSAGDMLLTSISLAVAVVPEGLPAVVTLTLALGIRSMAKRHALLRHLEAAETLGAASVVCSDKTGTITQNRMTAREIWIGGLVIDAGDAEDVENRGAADGALQSLATALLWCTHAKIEEDGVSAIGDPTETALLSTAIRIAGSHDKDREARLVDEIAFDSERRLMSVIVERAGRTSVFTKGGTEAVLARSTSVLFPSGPELLTTERVSEVEQVVEEMAGRGLRTIGVATRSLADGSDPESDLTLLGVVGLHDPPRPESRASIAAAKAAGVDVLMMTGDAPATAVAIATEVGLDAPGAVTGDMVDKFSDDELDEILDAKFVLARVTPAHKMRVVRHLQRHGAVVAMTGDGVNDAPALEQASIGIAMGERGTDVARGSADLILADDNFSTIIHAIEEGRRQHANIQKFVRYLLSSNLGEVVAISGSVLLGWPLILLPAQILWMNLLTDGVTAVALGAEPAEPDGMKHPPRSVGAPIVDREGVFWIAGLGTLIGLVSLVVFRTQLGLGEGADLLHAQTMAFTAMVMLEKFNVLNFRTRRAPIWSVGLRSNPWLVTAWLGAVAAQVFAVQVPFMNRALSTTPLSLGEWAALVLIASPILLVGELAKAVLRARERRRCGGSSSERSFDLVPSPSAPTR